MINNRYTQASTLASMYTQSNIYTNKDTQSSRPIRMHSDGH